MNFKSELAEILTKILSAMCAEAGREPLAVAAADLESPPSPDMGDYAFPCFKLSKALRKPPQAIAADMAERVAPGGFIDSAAAAGPYVNVFVNKAALAEAVLAECLTKGMDYGRSDIGRGRNIVIDYSSPNIAKLFHVGHLCTTVIGGALYKILEFIGYNCIGINHLGDWGTQFGKMMAAYAHWGDREEVEREDVVALNRLYVRFHKEAEADPALNDEARAWFLKMQNGDEEALGLWRWFCEISMRELERIYKRLNVSFDSYDGESFFNDKMDAVVEELRQKGLLKISNGASIVDLSDYNMPPCLILRSDGGTLYPTRDLAAAIYRKKTYDFHKYMIVTAMDQKLHFAQFFKVLELMGYDWAKDCLHIPYGLVMLQGGVKFSTRNDNAILMEDLLDEAARKTLELINEKNPELPDKERVAEQVGIGAMIFNDLYNTRINNVTFSWEHMLNFDGETGPYVQYTHARAQSVLTKAGVSAADPAGVDFGRLTDDASVQVIKVLQSFPDKILEAANKYEPFVLTRHVVALAQAFNRFYHENAILSAPQDVKNARLAVTLCTRNALKSGLALLGIAAPEQM